MAVLGAAFLWPPPVLAGALEEAGQLYADGDFLIAAERAAVEESVEAATLTARALLAAAAHRADGSEARSLLDRALLQTEVALMRNPDHVEAMLHRVIAIGYLSRAEGKIKAHRAGWGGEAKALWVRAEALEPENPWVHAVKGGWHAEVVSEAGSILASVFYGASKRRAIKAFERAVALAPENPFLRVEYARTLMRLGLRKHLAKAHAQLTLAFGMRPADAYERLVVDQGRALLAAIETGERKEMRRVFDALDAFHN